MKNKFLFGLIAVILVAVAGGWYVFSPGYAMSQLADAARAGDEAQLRDRIDFPRVRESLKTEMRARMAAELAKDGDDGPGKLGAALGLAFVDSMIDGLITPESIGAMVSSGKMKKPDDKAADQNVADLEWSIQRAGLSEFTAKPKSDGATDTPTLVFERDGLGWKLVEIDIPTTK